MLQEELKSRSGGSRTGGIRHPRAVRQSSEIRGGQGAAEAGLRFSVAGNLPPGHRGQPRYRPGRHPQRGVNVGRILFGSTATKLLRNCPCPVWVTRPDPNWDDLNILVPSDFSDVALEALRIAVNGGQLVDTRLHLLHALEGRSAPPRGSAGCRGEWSRTILPANGPKPKRGCTSSSR